MGDAQSSDRALHVGKRPFPAVEWSSGSGKNRYRMVVEIDYQRKEIYILFLGTHAEYNRIDATEV